MSARPYLFTLRVALVALGAALFSAPAASAQDTSANGDLSFHALVGGVYHIYKQPAGSSERINLTSGVDGWNTNPDWSPDGAGTYRVVDPTTGTRQYVEVAVTGSLTKKGILATWGAAPLTGARVFDVQIRKPGATGFTTWLKTTQPSGRFVPDKPGAYEVRARMRDTATGARPGWSPVRTIKVP